MRDHVVLAAPTTFMYSCSNSAKTKQRSIFVTSTHYKSGGGGPVPSMSLESLIQRADNC